MIQSPLFFLTLAASALVYWLLPSRFRDGFLAVVSFLYLARLDAVVVTTLVGWTLLFFYLAPHAIAAKKMRQLVVPGLILAILTYLAYHKYVPVLVSIFSNEVLEIPVLVPLGISYFTFKLIHYAVEASRGNIQDRSLPRFFCYIFLFPIFTAGPIERFDHFVSNREVSWQLQSTVDGVTRIMHGLIKMFVIASLLRPSFFGGRIPELNEVATNAGAFHPLQVWAFLVVSYLRAYMDFSAYSDIAIGASRLYGFRIMENFNFPVLAQNIGEFWRRWHMTLVGWCQSYIYLPMIGLTRRPYVAVYSTFVVIGLWHGGVSNWLLWGLYHATGVSIFLTWSRLRRSWGWQPSNNVFRLFVGVPATFAFVTGSYAFSTTEGYGAWAALQIFARLFGINMGA